MAHRVTVISLVSPAPRREETRTCFTHVSVHMTEWLLTEDAPGVHETSLPVSMWVPPPLFQPVHSDIQPAQAFGGEDALSSSHLLRM